MICSGGRERAVHRGQGYARCAVPREPGRDDAADDRRSATAAVSILLVIASSRGLRMVAPATFVPIAFAISGILLLASWLLTFSMPVLAARLVYLQISGLGPMLGSGFWLIATERFDPHTARHHFGRIAGVGTLERAGGALVAERVARIWA